MQYASFCDGLGTVHEAWAPLGWTCQWVSETNPIARAVTTHHWNLPNLGDMTRISHDPSGPPLDLLVAGTPCQAFSHGGKQRGLADPRGQLTACYWDWIRRLRPAWVVWENVPGILDTRGGADFARLLADLGECGYGWAYRVLDAQYFGVAQKRRRLYLVGHLGGDSRGPVSVLFDGNRLPGDPPSAAGPSPRVPPRGSGVPACYWDGGQLAHTLDHGLRRRHTQPERRRFHAVLIPAWMQCDLCEDYLCTLHHGLHVHECDCPAIDEWAEEGLYPYDHCVLRYLTPLECERLMGLPDDYTDVPYRGKPLSDTNRYALLADAMVVPVMRWIGNRLHRVHTEGLAA